MKLDKFYSLRKNFTIIGLTGRAGSGCSLIAKQLSDIEYISKHKFSLNRNSTNVEEIKFNICLNYLSYPGNWLPYTVINYKDILLLHVIYESFYNNNFIENFIDILCNNGNKEGFSNRFCREDDPILIGEVKDLLFNYENILSQYIKNEDSNFKKWLENVDGNSFINFFFNDFCKFSYSLHDLLNTSSITKRSRFNHDIAISLRSCGTCIGGFDEIGLNNEHIYVVAETINRLIKYWRKANENKARIIIDSLKNSLELMYFKEKFGAFYMIAVNKEEEERKKYISLKLEKNAIENWGPESKKPDEFKLSQYNDQIPKHSLELLKLDDSEAKGNQVNSGKFSVPDVENCIQKSDYHIFHTESEFIDYKNITSFKNTSKYQLIKLISLINQPGIITPTSIERTMQVAYNAKFNSGCISRQVGAVVADNNYIVKSIGWNDVAKNQMPCKLRDLNDLFEENANRVFSEYEIEGEVTNALTKETNKFIDLAKNEFDKSSKSELKGKHCSFCFKTFQNSFEGKDNQVHTRSLHAEENAMMQISKKGGNGLEGGKLFTTASPCELCSKKAYQLGIKEIYYIDPYPGIAMSHTLKNGIVNGNEEDNTNPKMIMFNGAVGRAYHKLYEPFMAYKDELEILTGINPKKRMPEPEKVIYQLDLSKEKKDKIIKIINE